MKKIILNSSLFLAMALSFTSCLKDKGFENGEYGIDLNGVPSGVGFPLASKTINSFAINLQGTTQNIDGVMFVNLLNGEPAKSDIHVVVQLNPALITAYNTANNLTGPAALVPLPANLYSVNLNLTIPAGERNIHVPIVVPSSVTLSPNTTYALGFSIQSVDGGQQIASNMKDMLISISIKNKYDGHYRVTGTFVDLTNALFTSVLPNEVDLITTGPNNVTVYRIVNGSNIPAYLFSNNGAGTYYGSFGANFQFDPATDNLIGVTNDYGQGTNNRWGAVDPTGASEGKNKFFTADHSVKAKYTMNQPSAGTVRSKFDETYTYIGPR